jgi:hypothetical protein
MSTTSKLGADMTNEQIWEAIEFCFTGDEARRMGLSLSLFAREIERRVVILGRQPAAIDKQEATVTREEVEQDERGLAPTFGIPLYEDMRRALEHVECVYRLNFVADGESSSTLANLQRVIKRIHTESVEQDELLLAAKEVLANGNQHDVGGGDVFVGTCEAAERLQRAVDARAASTSANVASKPAALDQGYVTVLIKRMQDYCDSLAPPMARGLMAEAVRALRAASTSSGRCFFCGEPMDGTHEQDCPQANDSANVAQGAEAVADPKHDLHARMKIAREAGLTLHIDGKFGSDHYHSVTGSWPAVCRFAWALYNAAPPAQTALTGRVLTYRNQPDNVGAWQLGEACRRPAELPAGDYIDRGLGLLKELQAKGYGVIALTAAQSASGDTK